MRSPLLLATLSLRLPSLKRLTPQNNVHIHQNISICTTHAEQKFLQNYTPLVKCSMTSNSLLFLLRIHLTFFGFSFTFPRIFDSKQIVFKLIVSQNRKTLKGAVYWIKNGKRESEPIPKFGFNESTWLGSW